MSSVHRMRRSPFWYCAFAVGAARHLKSTKTKDRRQAEIICRKWEQAGNRAKNGKLTPDAARQVIAQGVAEIFAGGGNELPSATVREWSQRWLESKSIELKPGSLERYKGTVESFLAHLGSIADKDIEHLASSHIQGFRNSIAKRLSLGSANLSLKIVRSMLSSAFALQLITRNPASATYVKTLEDKSEGKRRPLTVSEIKRLLTKAGEEWRGIILLGLYTGQRLSDVARLTWRAVDLENDVINFVSEKTGRRIILPLAKPLRAYLENRPSCENPNAALFPRTAKAKKVGHLSNMFREILVDAGLASVSNHFKTKKGRSARREVSEISFHSLRHSAVTMLKAAGTSDVLAREIVGHDSAAVSRSYTHLATEDLPCIGWLVRPASNATLSGGKADKPRALSSEFTNSTQSRYAGRPRRPAARRDRSA